MNSLKWNWRTVPITRATVVKGEFDKIISIKVKKKVEDNMCFKEDDLKKK